MSESCKTCIHYGLYQMITSGKPYGYSGTIPCQNCSRFSWEQDNYTPMSQVEIKPKLIINGKEIQ